MPAQLDRHYRQLMAIRTNQVTLDTVESPIFVSAVFRRVNLDRHPADACHQFIGVFLSK
jgi:hypothetical protein